MKVAIRVDASTAIGSGHLVRCLTLAGALRTRGAEVLFICRALPGDLSGMVESQGFRRLQLAEPDVGAVADPAPPHAGWLGVPASGDAAETAALLAAELPDWLVVDHYGLDVRWEAALRPLAGRIMAIDDLADRVHDCDVLLDQNYWHERPGRYDGLLPAHCLGLLGPRFALLRPEFQAARAYAGGRTRDGKVARVLVFFGASDTANATLKTLQALRMVAPALAVDVVVGLNNPHRDAIRAAAAAMSDARCHDYVEMAALMTAADLYLGAAGTTTWERCCLGLPSLVLALNAAQAAAIAELEQAGATCLLGLADEVSVDALAAAIGRALAWPGHLSRYSRITMALVDGCGAQRCSSMLFDHYERDNEQ